jgi:hypothetical protein
MCMYVDMRIRASYLFHVVYTISKTTYIYIDNGYHLNR